MTINSTVIISQCTKYRYVLSRQWNNTLASVCWVMLNPSTADASNDDPTIRRCINFTKNWGFGGIEVVNLFAYRSTSPKQLAIASDPVGILNDSYLITTAHSCDMTILGWGNHGKLFNRDRKVIKLLTDSGITLFALGKTKENSPSHPLYLRSDSTPVIFS